MARGVAAMSQSRAANGRNSMVPHHRRPALPLAAMGQDRRRQQASHRRASRSSRRAARSRRPSGRLQPQRWRVQRQQRHRCTPYSSTALLPRAVSCKIWPCCIAIMFAAA